MRPNWLSGYTQLRSHPIYTESPQTTNIMSRMDGQSLCMMQMCEIYHFPPCFCHILPNKYIQTNPFKKPQLKLLPIIVVQPACDVLSGSYLFVECKSLSNDQTHRERNSNLSMTVWAFLCLSPVHYCWMTEWKVLQGMTSHWNNGHNVCLICSWRALR